MIINNDDQLRELVVDACIAFAKSGGKYTGLAARTGISRITIANIVDGTTRLPRLRTAIILLLALGYKIEVLAPNQQVVYGPKPVERQMQQLRQSQHRTRRWR